MLGISTYNVQVAEKNLKGSTQYTTHFDAKVKLFLMRKSATGMTITTTTTSGF